jgi:peptidoglycan/xylan/chitin deacetylase (PgdA/CDA1 family)
MVLCYHGVTQRPTRHPDDHFGLQVREDRFRIHLDYLRRSYQVISIADYLRARAGELRLPDYSVIITFDDGYRNFYTAAAPVLESYQMTAAMFLISNRVVPNQSRPGMWREEDDHDYVSWHEVRDLIERGFAFGSHTCSHQKLPQLSPDQVEHELRDSKSLIERQTKTDRLPLAYPYGMTTDQIAARAASHGYACAFTSHRGFNDRHTDAFMLHRTLIGDGDDAAAFAARVAGLTR